MPPSAAAAAAFGHRRLKREDCPRTKHCSLFSPWKVLIGPSDWEGHSAGKDGVQRYRLHNLPENFPGLYELGVARVSDEGLRARRKQDLGRVVVVYLGQADNVRARLQQYGRTGSHLDCGNSSATCASKAEADASVAGPGLFREVFSRGCSLVFRCALMGNKQEAEKTEAQLLRVFDYAWNKLQNGSCRREEILLKLEQEEAVNYSSSLLRRARHFRHRIFGVKAGININRNRSVDTSSSIVKNILPKVRRFVGYRPQLVNSGGDGDGQSDSYWKPPNDGNSCTNREVRGTKIAEGCEVRNIHVIKQTTAPRQDCTSVCGIMLEDGSCCLETPVQGRKRCELHKGRRAKGNHINLSCSYPSCPIEIPVVQSMCRPAANANDLDKEQQSGGVLSKNLSTSVEESLKQRESFEVKAVKTVEGGTTADGTYETSEDADICGVEMSDSSVCKNTVMFGRNKCHLHSNWEVTQIDLSGLTDLLVIEDGLKEEMTFCAESPCPEKQLSGRMWFELIKAQSSTNTLPSTRPRFLTRVVDDTASICGVVTDDGCCRRIPIAGSKRCEEHRGIKIRGASFVPITESSGWLGFCGAPTPGSPCKNQPIPGRKRCALHKGQRAV